MLLVNSLNAYIEQEHSIALWGTCLIILPNHERKRAEVESENGGDFGKHECSKARRIGTKYFAENPGLPQYYVDCH